MLGEVTFISGRKITLVSSEHDTNKSSSTISVILSMISPTPFSGSTMQIDWLVLIWLKKNHCIHTSAMTCNTTAKGIILTPLFHVTQRCDFVTVHFTWIWMFHAIWDVLSTAISGTITHDDQQDCCKQTLACNPGFNTCCHFAENLDDERTPANKIKNFN